MGYHRHAADKWRRRLGRVLAGALISSTAVVALPAVGGGVPLAGGIISGAARDAASGEGVEGICVTAQSTSDRWEPSYQAATKVHGYYTIKVPDGSYRVWFTDCRDTPVYAKQYWKYSSTGGGSTLVSVAGANS